MNKKLTDSDKKKIFMMNHDKKSNTNIAKTFNVSKTTIRRVLDEKNLSSNAKNNGRPKKLNMRQERQIIRKFISGEAETTTEGVALAKKYANKDVSNSTIKKIIHKNGFKNYRKPEKPSISRSNLTKRKAFYEKFKNYTFQGFQNIIFTDESRFTLLNTNGGKTFYKKCNSPTNPKSFLRTKNLEVED